MLIVRPIRSLPWQWGQWRWNGFAWALPILYGFAIYLIVWLFGLGGSSCCNQDTLSEWSVGLLGRESSGIAAPAVYLLMLGTIGLVGSAARALGEEIGWRGFLIWEMRKVMPFWLVGILSGLIWAVWHWPAILFTDYNAGDGNFFLQMFIFTMATAPQGIVYAYFTFRTNSLWPAVILHASHNLLLEDDIGSDVEELFETDAERHHARTAILIGYDGGGGAFYLVNTGAVAMLYDSQWQWTTMSSLGAFLWTDLHHSAARKFGKVAELWALTENDARAARNFGVPEEALPLFSEDDADEPPTWLRSLSQSGRAAHRDRTR